MFTSRTWRFVFLAMHSWVFRTVALTALAALPVPYAAAQSGVAYTFEQYRLLKYNLHEGSRTTVHTGLRAYSVSVNNAGTRAYVGHQHGVQVLDLQTRSVVDFIDMTAPTDSFGQDRFLDVALAPVPGQQDETFLYVLGDVAAYRLTKVDIATRLPVTSYALPGHYTRFALSPTGDAAYLLGDNGLAHLDLDAGVLTPMSTAVDVSVRRDSDAVHVNSAGTRLYVATWNPAGRRLMVQEIELPSGDPLRTFIDPVSRRLTAVGLASGSSPDELLLGLGADGLAILNLATETVTQIDNEPAMGLTQGGIAGTYFVGGVWRFDGFDWSTMLRTRLDANLLATNRLRSGVVDMTVDPGQRTAYLLHDGRTAGHADGLANIVAVDLSTGAADVRVADLDTPAVPYRIPERITHSADGTRLFIYVHEDTVPGSNVIETYCSATGALLGRVVANPSPFHRFLTKRLMLDPDEAGVYIIGNFNFFSSTSAVTRVAYVDLATGTVTPHFEHVGTSGDGNLWDGTLLPGGDEMLVTTVATLGRLILSSGLIEPVVTAFQWRRMSPSVDGSVVAGVVSLDTAPWLGIALRNVATETEQLVADMNSMTGGGALLAYVNTADGSNITVEPIDTTTGEQNVTLSFENITSPGDTTVTSSTEGPDEPTGFQLGDGQLYFEITTTASYDGQITICIDYGSVDYIDENNLFLFHYKDGAWQNITTSVDTTSQIICGTTDSLSPFAVFELQPGLTAAGLLEMLVDDVAILNLQHGINNSLDAKLDLALDALDKARNNYKTQAVNAIESFILEVEAQSGQMIPAGAAAALVATALIVIELIQNG